jgi:hypothetical protein
MVQRDAMHRMFNQVGEGKDSLSAKMFGTNLQNTYVAVL